MRRWQRRFGILRINVVTLGTFARFVGVGAVATAAQYLVLVILVEAFRMDPVLSSAIGFIISSCLNYYLNYTYTYNSTSPHSVALPKFFTTVLAGLVINTGCMFIMVSKMHFYYIVAQVVATGITLLWNFSIHSLWSFKK